MRGLMAAWTKRRVVDSICLSFSKVITIFCWLLAAKLVSYGLETRNVRWEEGWFIVRGAWDC